MRGQHRNSVMKTTIRLRMSKYDEDIEQATFENIVSFCFMPTFGLNRAEQSPRVTRQHEDERPSRLGEDQSPSAMLAAPALALQT